LPCTISSLSLGGQRPPSSTESYISTITTKDENKKAKIREALEKMKEAKMKKIFVKIFIEDGTQRGILLDERWTVADTMYHLAAKLNCVLTPEHVILEEYPKLFISLFFIFYFKSLFCESFQKGL
jgi:amyloid beta A4 precursor protein-binding family B member 1-interacting protein